MATVLILGAGVMGSAIAVPAADNSHRVHLVGTHLDGGIIEALKTDRAAHPTLHAPLPAGIAPHAIDELTPNLAAEADLIIIGVSSPGIPWAMDRLEQNLRRPIPVALVTKGLHLSDTGLETFTDRVARRLEAIGKAAPVIGIGGPCIAKELADRQPTAVVYAGKDAASVGHVADMMQTAYYRVSRSRDVIGVEICAALKNLLTIAVSAMYSRHAERNPQPAKPRAMNPAAAIFNQAVREMAGIAAWLGGDRMTAYDLAGLGDLHVTVGGGRNSRLGDHLGAGLGISQALSGPMAGLTVEGVDTGRVLAPALEAAFSAGRLNRADFPVIRALLDAIRDDTPLDLDIADLRPQTEIPADRRQHA